MLGDYDAFATLAVRDLSRAKDFYENTIGLKIAFDTGGGISYASGKTGIFVYESEFAGTNKATAIGWVVKDIEAMVASLKAKGVVFEHYDMPDTKLEGDVHVMGNLKSVWFKDPDDNILNITNGME